MSKNLLHTLFGWPARNGSRVEVMYFGRASEFLMITSECMAVPETGCALEQLMSRLRARGGRWAHELDRGCVLCTVNGKVARQKDIVEAGATISINSTRGIFGT